MNSLTDTGQAPSLPIHPALQALDVPVMIALVVAAMIGLVWMCWKAQSKD